MNKLKGLLRERGVTYELAASTCRCSVGALANKVNGKSAFTVNEMMALIGLLNLTTDDIGIFIRGK